VYWNPNSEPSPVRIPIHNWRSKDVRSPSAQKPHSAGAAVAPAGGACLATTNPATRAPGDEIAAGTSADVERAVAGAATAWPGWAARPAADRADALHALADAMAASAGELAELERVSTGKTDGQLTLEIDMSVAYFRYYAPATRWSARWRSPAPSAPGATWPGWRATD